MLAITGQPSSFLPPPELTQRRSPLDALWRRRTLFLTTVAAFTVLVAVVVLLLPKSYTANVRFIAGNGNAPIAGNNQTVLPILNAILDLSSAQSSETYAEMLRETPAVERVIAKEHLDMTPRALLRHVSVKPVTNTSILDVGVSWRDPEGAAQIANSLADAFVDVRRNLISAQADAAIGYISDQLPTAQQRMARSAAMLASYQAHNGIADETQQTQAMLAGLADVDRKLAAAEVDKQQAAAQLAIVQEQLSRMPPTITGGRQVAPNPAISQLNTQLAQVDVQLKTALEQYTPEHPSVRALQTQDAQLRRQIASLPATIVASDSTVTNPVLQSLIQTAATLKAQIASATSQIATLSGQRESAQPAVRALPKRTAELLSLKRQAKQDEDVYNSLAQKLGEARIARTTSLSDVSVISRASSRDVRVAPVVLVDIAVGFLIAIFVGFGAVFAAERLDGSIKTEADVARALALPVLSSVPRLPPDGMKRPQWLEAATVDAFLQLVTSLRYASSERLVTIAFTSPDARDGKSLVALNTAIALAELSPRVLLVDADLRLPSLHQKLGIRATPGLSDVLVGTVSFEQGIHATEHPGLDVIVAGTGVPNGFALLQSNAFERFVQQAREKYETILIDTPACAAVVDAAVVCARADGTVYVVASRETDSGQAERGLARLRSAGVRNVVGAVLNKAPAERSTIGAYGELADGTRGMPLPPPRSAAGADG